MNLSVELINKMKHCIGYQYSRIEKGKFLCRRNYYSVDFDEDFEIAINLGLATKRKGRTSFYCLTTTGLKTLSSILDCDIKETQ